PRSVVAHVPRERQVAAGSGHGAPRCRKTPINSPARLFQAPPERAIGAPTVVPTSPEPPRRRAGSPPDRGAPTGARGGGQHHPRRQLDPPDRGRKERTELMAQHNTHRSAGRAVTPVNNAHHAARGLGGAAVLGTVLVGTAFTGGGAAQASNTAAPAAPSQ